MAYLDLLEDETTQSHYLVIIKPRRRVTGFSLHSGSVYVADFDYGEVTKAWDGLTELSLGSSSSLSSGQFWHDVSENKLYVRLVSGNDPDTVWLIASYEIYAGTIDAHHYRVPTDNTTRVVYFDPIISKSNQIKQSTENAEFGFSPTQTSTLSLINAEHIFEKHLYDSSFNKAECLIYHWLGDLETTNIKQVLNGVILSYKLDPPRLDLRVADRIDILTNDWAHPSGQNQFFDTTTFPSLDQNYNGRPIRVVYGYITDGYIPVNIDYVSESPTTSDNRTFVVTSGQSYLDDVQKTVLSSPSSTTTRTYINSVTGLNVGDTIILDKSTDEYAEITAIGANYIDHTTIVTPAIANDIVKRSFVGYVTIVQDGVSYKALYGRDYDVSFLLSGGTSGFIFSSSLESNLSIPNTISPLDSIFCRVYGPSNFVTLSGPAFGTSDTRSLTMAHPSQIVLDILKRHLGVSESEINISSFNSALTDQSTGISISVPETSSSSTFPKYRDVISQILKSCLSKLIIDSDGKWTMLVTKPLGAVTKSIGDDEILRNSITWDYDYEDMFYQVNVEYDVRETSVDLGFSEVVSVVTSTNDIAKYLHKNTKTRTERSRWTFEQEAQELADRLAYMFGDRRSLVTLRTKNRFYDTKLGDNIEIQRSYLPGYNPTGTTVFSREHAVSQIEKSRTQVTITLDDRKGIEDNSGGW